MAKDNIHYRMPENACHKCQERHLGCHSACDKYKAFKTDLNEKRTVSNEAKRELDINIKSKDRRFKSLKGSRNGK